MLESFHQFLINYNFYILLGHLILIITLSAINSKYIIKLFSQIKKKTWIILSIILIIFFTTMVVFNHSPYWSNEPQWWHMINAKSFAQYQRAYHINEPHGHAFLLSLGYFIGGINNTTTYVVNSIIATMTVFVIFLLTYTLFKNQSIALISALFMGIMPRHIFFSGTGENEVSSIFFVMLFLLFTFIVFSERKKNLYILSLITLAYAMQIRIENSVFILIFMGLGIFDIYNSTKRKDIVKKLGISLLIFIIIISPLSYWILNYGATRFMIWNVLKIESFKPDPIKGKEEHYPEYYKNVLSGNIKNFSSWFFKPSVHNPFILALFFLSFLFIKEYKIEMIILYSLIVIYALIYILYYTGYFFRYIVYFNAPIAIISAFSLVKLTRLIKSKFQKHFLATLLGIILVSSGVFGYDMLKNHPIDTQEWFEIDYITFSNEDYVTCMKYASLFQYGKWPRLTENKTQYFIYTDHENNHPECPFYRKDINKSFDMKVIEEKETIILYEITPKNLTSVVS